MQLRFCSKSRTCACTPWSHASTSFFPYVPPFLQQLRDGQHSKVMCVFPAALSCWASLRCGKNPIHLEQAVVWDGRSQLTLHRHLSSAGGLRICAWPFSLPKSKPGVAGATLSTSLQPAFDDALGSRCRGSLGLQAEGHPSAVLQGMLFALHRQSFTCPSPLLQPPAGRREVRAGGVSAPTEALAAPFPTALWLLYLLRAPLWWVPVQGWEGSPVPPGGGGGGGVGRGQPGALPDVGKEKAGGTLSSLLPPPKSGDPLPRGGGGEGRWR